jgi:hypothetical protein
MAAVPGCWPVLSKLALMVADDFLALVSDSWARGRVVMQIVRATATLALILFMFIDLVALGKLQAREITARGSGLWNSFDGS